MLARWEPFSPMRLIDKTHQLQGQGESLSPQMSRGSFHRKISSQDLLDNRRASLMNITETIDEEQQAEAEAEQEEETETKIEVEKVDQE